jgi:hypothetical protein
MSILAHNYSVIGLLVLFFINILVLFKTDTIEKMVVRLLMITPTNGVFLGSVIFTGVIMMAAKHLEFSIENILMIIVSVILIVLEAKKSKAFKYLDRKKDGALEIYKSFAIKLSQIEIVIVLLISVWMWYLA